AALTALLVHAHVALRHIVGRAQEPKCPKKAICAAAAAIRAHKCALLSGLHKVRGTKRHLTDLSGLSRSPAAKVALTIANRSAERTVSERAAATHAARPTRAKCAGPARG